MAAMAKKLGMDEAAFRETYVRRIGRRYSLKEDPASKDCVFLTETTENGKGCAIYDVRPMQCRTWPFWPGNLTSGQAWAAAGMRCRGINRGPLHDCDEIDAKKNATR
jgi:Fe-S-cluster containining protein